VVLRDLTIEELTGRFTTAEEDTSLTTPLTALANSFS
jgi:hypothetical protein